MRGQFLVLLAAAHLTAAVGTQVPFREASSAPNIERLIPIDWMMTQSVQGDLNGDGTQDVAAVLLRGVAADGNPVEQAGSRGLLVLFADPAGGYRFQDFAPEALPCISCLADPDEDPRAPAFALSISDQRLTVGWRRASPEATEVKLIIGYDRERNTLRLLGDEILTNDRLSGKPRSVLRDYEAGTMTADGKESRIAPRFIPLIDVSAEDY